MKNELQMQIEHLPVLKIQWVLGAEKVKIYKTLMRPVAMYGAESWTLKKVLLNAWLLLEDKC